MAHQSWSQRVIDLLYILLGRPREPYHSPFCWYLPNEQVTVTVSKSSYLLRVEMSGCVREFPVAIGANPDGGDKLAAGDKRTPEGAFRVCQKLTLSKPHGGYGSHWLRLDTRHLGWEGIGIHGTNKPESIGTKATAGCIRLRNADIVELYHIVPLGALVTIVP